MSTPPLAQAFGMSSTEGCWVAYGLDHSEHWSTAVFDDELAAYRHAAANHLHVGFLRWGQSLDAVEAPAASQPS